MALVDMQLMEVCSLLYYMSLCNVTYQSRIYYLISLVIDSMGIVTFNSSQQNDEVSMIDIVSRMMTVLKFSTPSAKIFEVNIECNQNALSVVMP